MRHAKFWIIIGVATTIAALAFVLVRNFGSISFVGSGSGASGTDASGTAAPAPARDAPAGYKEYRNARYHFSLFFPDNLQVVATDQAGTALTVTFQNIKTVEGFQVYVVAYGQSQVSEAQFKRDEPSGVRTNPQNATIAGATAVTFNSKDTRLSDTYEIWFIHGGYLYEVTTLKPLDTWLQGIMQSWQFI